MIQRKTVFVIGAGASSEFGLPLGGGLRDQIYNQARTISDESGWNGDFYKSLLSSGIPDIGTNLIPKMRQFADGLLVKPSIDQYLDFHREDLTTVGLGKFSIVYHILLAETASRLRLEGNSPLQGALGSYLSTLLTAMNDGIDADDPGKMFDNVSIVCFNYDRCIELYMILGIAALTRCSYVAAADMLKRLRIWHPYGTVGPLFDPLDTSGRARLMFSLDNLSGELARQNWRSIRTFTERMTDHDMMSQIHEAFMEAERVVFLGFSFLDQNMKLLGPPNPCNEMKEIHATVFGMSSFDQTLANASIASAFRRGNPATNLIRTELHNVTSGQFMASAANYLRK